MCFSEDEWTNDHETRLREHVSRLKAERSNIQGTFVVLESTQVENPPIRPSSSQEARKMDLEMAVLMQVINAPVKFFKRIFFLSFNCLGIDEFA